jgi:hypothetical protein
MPLKATAAARTHRVTASRVTSRRSAATICASRDASPVTIDAAEESQTRLARCALAATLRHSRLMVPAMTPRFVTRTGSAAPISSTSWHQAMTTANSVTAATTKTMNTSATSSREPVVAMTRASTSDPITTPHDTAPVRRRGTRMAGSAVRRRHHPTTPARARALRSDNDAQAIERDLRSSSRCARVGSIDQPAGHPAFLLAARSIAFADRGRVRSPIPTCEIHCRYRTGGVTSEL